MLTLLGAMLLAFSGVVLAQQPGADPSGSSSSEDFAEGEILVKFKKATSNAKKQKVHEEKNGKTKEVIGGIDVEVVAVDKGKEKSKVRDYQNDPNVEYAEVNSVYEAVANTPNDPRAGEQWQFNNPQYTEPKKGDIDAYEAWNGGSSTAWDGGVTGSSSVPIAILDTGINKDHEDFTDPTSNASKVTKNVNFTDTGSTSGSSDIKGHGTHVAGSAAAVTNNGKGVAGTCPGCPLYNVKVLGDTGSGYTSWISNGITWAADNGAKVINLSLGSSSFSSTQQDAVNYAWGKGVVVVAAAGNSNTSTQFYPAAYPNVIAVGATDSNDTKASFSNYGSSWVDVAAPGVNILSTTVDGGYGLKSGTSMASPHVAGEAGLVWGTSYGTTNSAVRDRIETNTDTTADSNSNWTNGRINTNGGVSGSTTTPPPSDTTPGDTTAPSVTSNSPTGGREPVTSSVKATFSEAMKQSTITNTTFTLKAPDGSTVSASVSYDPISKTATLKPSRKLSSGRQYTATLTSGATDEANNALDCSNNKCSWTFTTR